MTRIHLPRLSVLLLAAAFAAAPALAKKDEDKHEQKHERKAKNDDHGGKGGKDKGGQQARKPQQGAYFDERNREAVHKYYATAKNCPPGLAKKNNGCMPPGQAKKQWHVGQPLPTTVVYQPVPHQIIVSLPPVPTGHKYVQVAGDILLVAVGSMMVVDGINGLMSR